MEEFTVEIAGVPVGIRCRYPENREFLREYLSEKDPLLFIEPTDGDLQRRKDLFDRIDGRKGMPPQQRDGAFLENSVLYALMAEKLSAYDVLLMHGSALCMDGEAYVFTAASGTGKSTHARLWRETFGDRVWMINDDKPMLRIEAEKVMVYGTPWNGGHHLSRNASAPLKAVICLNRGPVNRIEAISRTEAFPVLASHIYNSGEPDTRRKVSALEMELMERGSFYRLSCNMLPEAARTAWQGMNEDVTRQ